MRQRERECDRDGYVAASAEGSDHELVDDVISDPTSSLVTFVRVDGEWKLVSDAFFSR